MDFEHACFISYRNGKKVKEKLTDDLLNTFVSQVYDALESEMKAYFDFEQLVFLDFECLKPGEFLIPVFSKALCRSVAMIVVFTPNYFSHHKMFCASEFRGMVEIEENRNKLLATDGCDSIIITVVLRGEKYVPDYLKKRVFHDFSPFDLSQVEIKRHPEFNKKIREITEMIYSIYAKTLEECNKKPVNLLSGCETFKIADIENNDESQLVKKFIGDVVGIKMKAEYPQM